LAVKSEIFETVITGAAVRRITPHKKRSHFNVFAFSSGSILHCILRNSG
jgi:hypothetical protein